MTTEKHSGQKVKIGTKEFMFLGEMGKIQADIVKQGMEDEYYTKTIKTSDPKIVEVYYRRK
jgi:hypothetical protein